MSLPKVKMNNVFVLQCLYCSRKKVRTHKNKVLPSKYTTQPEMIVKYSSKKRKMLYKNYNNFWKCVKTGGKYNTRIFHDRVQKK